MQHNISMITVQQQLNLTTHTHFCCFIKEASSIVELCAWPDKPHSGPSAKKLLMDSS